MMRSVTGSLYFLFRILLALAQLFILLDDPVSALPYALNCLTVSCSHFMDNSAALASLYIAQIQVYRQYDAEHYYSNVFDSTVLSSSSVVALWICAVRVGLWD